MCLNEGGALIQLGLRDPKTRGGVVRSTVRATTGKQGPKATLHLNLTRPVPCKQGGRIFYIRPSLFKKGIIWPQVHVSTFSRMLCQWGSA